MLHSSRPSQVNTKLPLPESILRQLQHEKQELYKIKEQQQTIFSIDQTFKKKNSQILKLKTLVDKYQPFYQKYQDLSYDYSEKCAKLNQKEKQLSILLQQFNELLRQNQLIENKFLQTDQERNRLIKEQRQIQKVNQEIEQTFKLYQEECKKKEMGLLRDLEKAYKQVTQLNKRIDEYEMKVFENQELKRKLNQKIAIETAKSLEEAQKPKHTQPEPQLIQKHLLELKHQNQTLKHLLNTKEDELTKYKILNHQLSIEFDKSVSRICEFEKELTKYRQENHELQKMLNLFVEKQKYEKMHLRQLQKVKARKNQQIEGKNQDSEIERNNFEQGQNYSESSPNQLSESEDVYE